MEDQHIEEMMKTQQETPVVEERLRTPMTILFSDIKDSTAYFERRGDVEGLAMVERHNNLLFPCVENNNGRIIKTIGDAIMALFLDPVDAVTAAARRCLRRIGRFPSVRTGDSKNRRFPHPRAK